MKKILVPASFAIASVLMSCGGSSNNQSAQNSSQPAAEIPAQVNEFDLKIDFISDQQNLPDSVDFSRINLDKYNYAQLFVLRHYPYALHGFWFKDCYLNCFFCHNTNWYSRRCDENYSDSDSYDSNYWELWDGRQESAMSMVQLSDIEKSFVEKVDAKLAELDKTKFLTQNSLALANPDNVNNSFQFPSFYGNKDSKLYSLLKQHNVAFASSKYDQLFNVYEENDYQLVPSFVTTDLFLQAFHMYFEFVMKDVETNLIIPKLSNFYKSMHNFASTNEIDEQEYYDFVSAFFAIAIKQLNGSDVAVKDNYKSIVDSENQAIVNAVDQKSKMLNYDFYFPYSLFKPRGHYTKNDDFKNYFRSMMWLQTASFELSKPDDVRRCLAIAFCYNNIDDAARKDIQDVNKVLNFMMGEPDNLAIMEVADYIKKKYPDAGLSDLMFDEYDAIATWIKKQLKEKNRIKPKVEISDSDKLNFMPQRYTIDGEILSQMYDEKPNAERAYPKGLDIFDVLGFDPATKIQDTLYKNDSKVWADYSGTRRDLRDQFRSFDSWNKSNYNKWIEVLLSLENEDKTYPDYMKTSAWHVKNTNTALASWSELKHDAILYAEQPMGAECGGGEELPEPVLVGYIEPNVAFWSKLIESVDLITNTLKTNNMLSHHIENSTENFREKIAFCLDISKKELAKRKISTEDYRSIRNIGASIEYMTLGWISEDEVVDNWNFVSGPDKKVAVVADVFTRNIPGCSKGGILYEATGYPNVIYVIVEIEGKLYLTRGSSFSYYEFVRPNENRLNDEEWQKELENNPKMSQPEWFVPLIIDEKIESNQNFLYSSGC